MADRSYKDITSVGYDIPKKVKYQLTSIANESYAFYFLKSRNHSASSKY
jgi:hypothetical protein